MGIGNFKEFDFGDAGPIEAAVGFAWRFLVIAFKDDAERVFGIDGDLFMAVGA